jgi:GGDEF domain-containing protein
VVKQMANLLKKESLREDCLIRWEEDEFLFVIENSTDDAAFNFSQKIEAIIEEHNFGLTNNKTEIKVTTGIHVAYDDSYFESAIVKAEDEIDHKIRDASKKEVL